MLPGFWKKSISMRDVVGSWFCNASEPCVLSCSSLLHPQHAQCKQHAPGQPACGVSKWTKRDGSALGGGQSWVTAESARSFMEGISLLSLHLPIHPAPASLSLNALACPQQWDGESQPQTPPPPSIHARQPHGWPWAQSFSGQCWVVAIMPEPGETPPGNAGCKFRSRL